MKKDIDLIVSIKVHWKTVDLLIAKRPKQKEILDLRVKGYSRQEISNKLWKSKSDVWYLLNKAIQKCKEYFIL